MTREGIKEDAEDDNQGRLCHGELIVDWVGCWSGSLSIGVGIAATSATKWRPKTAEVGPFFVAEVMAMPTWIHGTPPSDTMCSKFHGEHNHRNLDIRPKSMRMPMCFCSKSAHSERKTCGKTAVCCAWLKEVTGGEKIRGDILRTSPFPLY
jgi:hypothetical protein